MSAVISDTFVIDVVQVIDSSSITVANPGRAFKVVQVLVTGSNGAVCTVKKNTTGGALVSTGTLATGDLNAFPSAMTSTAADAVFSATDNISITAATAAVGRITLLCASATGYDLTVT